MSDVVIKIAKNGSYDVMGKVTILDPEGNEIPYDGDQIWLCRCGHSTTKPFCDGSHRKVGFESEPKAADFA